MKEGKLHGGPAWFVRGNGEAAHSLTCRMGGHLVFRSISTQVNALAIWCHFLSKVTQVDYHTT